LVSYVGFCNIGDKIKKPGRRIFRPPGLVFIPKSDPIGLCFALRMENVHILQIFAQVGAFVGPEDA